MRFISCVVLRKIVLGLRWGKIVPGIEMVPLFKYRKYTGFEIDFLLGPKQTISSCSSDKDSVTRQRKMMDTGRLYCESSGSLPICASHVHSKDINFCPTCFENNSHENIINSIRPNESPSYSDLMRSGGLSTNTLPLIDTANVVPQIQNSDIRQSSLGSLGIKLHNNLTHLENLSNLSNISNINPGYSSIANLYSPSSHLARVCSPPHIDRALSGTTLSWTQTRAGGLFTSRCNGKWFSEILIGTRCFLQIFDLNIFGGLVTN